MDEKDAPPRHSGVGREEKKEEAGWWHERIPQPLQKEWESREVRPGIHDRVQWKRKAPWRYDETPTMKRRRRRKDASHRTPPPPPPPTAIASRRPLRDRRRMEGGGAGGGGGGGVVAALRVPREGHTAVRCGCCLLPPPLASLVVPPVRRRPRTGRGLGCGGERRRCRACVRHTARWEEGKRSAETPPSPSPHHHPQRKTAPWSRVRPK